MVFDCHATQAAVTENRYAAPIAAVALYIGVVFAGPPLMRRGVIAARKLKGLFAGWNLCLSLFSMWGLAVLLPHWTNAVATKGLHHVLCDDAFIYGNPTHDADENYAAGATCYGPPGLASLAFMFSKFPELFDTAFLVVKGKPIATLQWWHHATVLLYCWHAVVLSTPSAVSFAVMNYAVHSVMYLYFAVSQYTRKLGWLRKPITIIQMAQMILGIFFVAMCIVYENTSYCSQTYQTGGYYLLCGGMYLSYLLLFAQFYVQAYTQKPKGV